MENPLARVSDDDLVAAHSTQGINSHFISEMLRRHKDVTVEAGNKINKLTWALLIFTVVIAALTGVLVYDAITRGHSAYSDREGRQG